MNAITPYYRSIKDLFQCQSFSIDEYQREYNWEKSNIEELVLDLKDKFFKSYKAEHDPNKVSDYEEYFLGSIIVSNRAGKKYLIDGQQRITSLTLLLIYLHREATEKSLDVAKTLANLIYSDNFGTPSFNLNIPERLQVIEALFYGRSFSTSNQDESVRNIYSRYQDIEECELTKELGQAIPHFIYWLMSRVGLIEIVTTKDDYAYSIFETMNDRGKPLSPVDMLKAYLLAPVDNMEQRHVTNQKWRHEICALNTALENQKSERDTNFVKAWFRSQYAESIRERKARSGDKDWELIGSEFYRWARENAERLKIGKSEQNQTFIHRDLPFYADAYRRIVKASNTYERGLESIFYNAHNNFTWQTTVLLAPLTPTENSTSVEKKIAVTSIYLDIWIMRRAVNYSRVTYSNASYVMFNLCRAIRGKPLEELVDILSSHLQDDEHKFDGVPSKDRTGISGLRLNQFSRKYIFHLLARLTSYVESQSGGADRFPEFVDRNQKNSYDIEHIWADKRARYAGIFRDDEEFRATRDNVAALILLPADVNRSFQDKTFAEKSQHYAKQNLFAASLTEATYQHQPRFEAFRKGFKLPFEPFTDFGLEEQKRRQELIHALVEVIWSPQRLFAAIK